MDKPIYRSPLRRKAGMFYYGMLRKLLWIRKGKYFASTKSELPLEYVYKTHKTVLLRKLKDVDMELQRNKVTNLRLATKRINGIIIRPGEVFSYWKLIGNPSKRKGYLEGMVLRNGKVDRGVGGGLCQLSNMIFWMTLHTPLTVIERHRHGYDVFPDSNRTQPFGSGATCFYPHGDLMIRNDTEDTYQILVTVGEKDLIGEIRVSSAPKYKYEVVEKNHIVKGEFWGGHSRHNEIWQQRFDLDGGFIDEVLAVENSAIMMYSPFLEPPETAYRTENT